MQKNKVLALLRCCITISIPFVVALITVIVIRSCNPVIVSGQSMKPTLNNGELVFGDKSFTVDDLKRGTIIVFKDPEDEIRFQGGFFLIYGLRKEICACRKPGLSGTRKIRPEHPVFIERAAFPVAPEACSYHYEIDPCRPDGSPVDLSLV